MQFISTISKRRISLTDYVEFVLPPWHRDIGIPIAPWFIGRHVYEASKRSVRSFEPTDRVHVRPDAVRLGVKPVRHILTREAHKRTTQYACRNEVETIYVDIGQEIHKTKPFHRKYSFTIKALCWFIINVIRKPSIQSKSPGGSQQYLMAL